MAQIGELTIGFKNDEVQLKAATQQVQTEFTKAGVQAGKSIESWVKSWLDWISRQLSLMKNLILWVFWGSIIVDAVKGLFNFAGWAEQALTAFETLTGSLDSAKEIIWEIDKFAAKTPFNKLWTQWVVQQLIAFWFNWKQALAIVNWLGEWISAAWKTGENLTSQLQWVALAVWQIKAKGKLSAEELLQLTERGIPAYDILTKKLNLTEKELANIGNAWIKSDVAIKALIEWLNERFWWNMAKQAQNLIWVFSNIVDTFQQWVAKIGIALTPVFTEVLKFIASIGWPLLRLAELLAIQLSAVFVVFKDALVAGFEWLKQSISFTSEFVKTNRQSLLDFLLASRLLTIAFIKRAIIIDVLSAIDKIVVSRITAMSKIKFSTIKDFVWWTVTAIINWTKTVLSAIKTMVIGIVSWTVTAGKSIYFLVTNLKALTTELFANTTAWIKNKAQIVSNTAASWRQAISNIFTATTFKAVWVAIWWTIKQLVILTLRFLAISWVVGAVVLAIFVSWTLLKDKLKPIFEFIAKIWRAAPKFIADGRNLLVDVVFLSIKSIIAAAWWLAKFLKDSLSVDIWVEKIQAASNAVNNFTNKIKITGDDVSSVFWDIKDSAVSAFGAVSGAISGVDTKWTTQDLTDLNAIFPDIEWNWRKAWKATSESMKEAKNSIDKVNDSVSDFEKWVTKLEKSTEKYAEDSVQFYKEIQDSIDETTAKITDSNTAYNKLIADIEAGASEKQKENLTDFVTNQVSDQADAIQKLAELKKEITAEELKPATTADEISRKTERLNDLAKEQLDLETQILDIKENIASVTTTDDQKKTLEDAWINIEELLAKAQERAWLSDTGRQLFDFTAEQEQIDKDKALKLKSEEEKFKAEQETLAKRQAILEIFKNTSLENDIQINQQSLELKVWLLNAEELAFAQSLINKRVQLQNDFADNLQLEKDLNNAKLDLATKTTELLLLEWKKIRDDVQATITKINEAITRMNTLKSWSSWSWIAGARANWWPVASWSSYLVWEQWPEIFTPNWNWQIIPNIKTLLWQITGWAKPTITTTKTSSSNIDKSVKIDKIDVRNGRDFLNYLEEMKRRNK